MNSSTKPPQPARKFNFDTDFQAEDERLRTEMLRQQELENFPEEVEPVVVAPSFSEDEMQQACRTALEQGIQQGRQEAQQMVESAVLSVLERTLSQMELLLNAEQQRLELAQMIALNTTIATIKKIWPNILQQLGLPLIESTLRQSMEYNPEEPRIVVRVHDSLLDAVVQRLPQLQQQQAFAGKVIVLSDAGVIAGDCKIEWADGGLERLSRTLSQQLDSALERLLSALKTSQNVDPERNEQ